MRSELSALVSKSEPAFSVGVTHGEAASPTGYHACLGYTAEIENNQTSGETRPEVEMLCAEMRRKVKERAPLNKQWSVEEKESILDYLHGNVAPDEVKAVLLL